MARIVGVNSTFEQQRVVINEIALDVEALQVWTAGTWAVSETGIHTSKNVGIGTTDPTSSLTVVGDGSFTGIISATRF